MNVRQIIVASIRMILARYERRVFIIEVWRLVASAPCKTARMNARRSSIKNWKCIFFICIYTSHPRDFVYFDFAGNRKTRSSVNRLNQFHSRSQSFELLAQTAALAAALGPRVKWTSTQPLATCSVSRLLQNSCITLASSCIMQFSCAHAWAAKIMGQFGTRISDYGEWICELKNRKLKKSPTCDIPLSTIVLL